jgi:hypothetical protein
MVDPEETTVARQRNGKHLSSATNCKYYLRIDNLLAMTMTNDRPILSSERAPHNDKTVTIKQ